MRHRRRFLTPSTEDVPSAIICSARYHPRTKLYGKSWFSLWGLSGRLYATCRGRRAAPSHNRRHVLPHELVLYVYLLCNQKYLGALHKNGLLTEEQVCRWGDVQKLEFAFAMMLPTYKYLPCLPYLPYTLCPIVHDMSHTPNACTSLSWRLSSTIHSRFTESSKSLGSSFGMGCELCEKLP
jgi:hypothetical protein